MYISEEAEILLYVLAFLSVFGALFVSAISNKRWLASVPDAHSYHWGFFFGWLNFMFYTGFATLIFISVLADETDIFRERNRDLLIALLFSMAISLMSYGVLKKNRLSWIVVTALSMNPVGWVINYFYLKRRREYIRGGYQDLVGAFLNPYLALPRSIRIISSGTLLWIVSVTFGWELFSLSDHFYRDGVLLKIVSFPPIIGVMGYLIITKLWK